MPDLDWSVVRREDVVVCPLEGKGVYGKAIVVVLYQVGPGRTEIIEQYLREEKGRGKFCLPGKRGESLWSSITTPWYPATHIHMHTHTHNTHTHLPCGGTNGKVESILVFESSDTRKRILHAVREMTVTVSQSPPSSHKRGRRRRRRRRGRRRRGEEEGEGGREGGGGGGRGGVLTFPRRLPQSCWGWALLPECVTEDPSTPLCPVWN